MMYLEGEGSDHRFPTGWSSIAFIMPEVLDVGLFLG